MWPNPQETAYLVTFTEKIPNGKLHFLCSAIGLSISCGQFVWKNTFPIAFWAFFVSLKVMSISER